MGVYFRDLSKPRTGLWTGVRLFYPLDLRGTTDAVFSKYGERVFSRKSIWLLHLHDGSATGLGVPDGARDQGRTARGTSEKTSGLENLGISVLGSVSIYASAVDQNVDKRRDIREADVAL